MSLQPARRDLTVWRRATFRQRFTMFQGETPDSDPYDLTNFTASMVVLPERNASIPLLTLTTENGGISLGGSAGTIDLYIPDSDTDPDGWRTGLYELVLIDGSNDDKDLILHGAMRLKGIR